MNVVDPTGLAGCGPGSIHVPNRGGLFTAACDFHDNCYGSFSTYKSYCDVTFWHMMNQACKSAYAWWSMSRYDCLSQSLIYFGAVKAGGGPLFFRGHYDACRRRRYQQNFCVSWALTHSV